MLYIFWNQADRRLRAGWRILIQGLVYWLILSGVQQVIFALLADNALRFAYPLATLLVSLLALWLAGRFLDRRPSFADFGFHFNARWWADLAFGLFLGAFLMTLIFGVERAAGWVTVTGTFHGTGGIPFWQAILFGLWQYVAVGVNEEVLSRGYHLRNLAEGLNLARLGPRKAFLLAYGISSSMFGLFHLLNPNASWVSTLALMLAGLFLGLGYVLTGELAIPIGIHITWNFFQGRVFGFPVSGGQPTSSILLIEQGGPLVWTGGDFGPEAGLIGLAAILLGCLLVVLWVRWRHGRLAWQDRLAVYQRAGENL